MLRSNFGSRALTTFVALSLCASKASGQFRAQVIADDLRGGYQVVAADINHDGKPDLIAVATGMTELVWFENPKWERHVIARNLSRMINLGAADIDGDGIPELALAHEFDPNAKNSIGIISLLHHNGDPREPWTVTEIDRLSTSHRLRFADIDGSGRKVLINAPLTGALAIAPDYKDATPLVCYRPPNWKRELITGKNQGVVHALTIFDWDGDGRDDILTAGFLGVHRHQLDKNGSWTRTEVVKGDPAAWPKSGSSDVAIGRLKNKRFLATIEPWHGNQVVVYLSEQGNWKRSVIDTSLIDGHALVIADLNSDGRDKIVAGMRGGGHKVYVYTASDSTGLKWDRSVLDDGGMSASNCIAVDLDGDRRIDIVCIGSATHNLKVYQSVKASTR